MLKVTFSIFVFGLGSNNRGIYSSPPRLGEVFLTILLNCKITERIIDPNEVTFCLFIILNVFTNEWYIKQLNSASVLLALLIILKLMLFLFLGSTLIDHTPISTVDLEYVYYIRNCGVMKQIMNHFFKTDVQ